MYNYEIKKKRIYLCNALFNALQVGETKEIVLDDATYSLKTLSIKPLLFGKNI